MAGRSPTLAPYVDRERDRILQSLLEWLRIPSISADPDHTHDLARSAQFTADLLRGAGLENVEVISDFGAPAVYGDWLRAGPTARTVLVYGHHDVQPVDPLDEWLRPPFEPAVVDGECVGRGASDDKGQVLFNIEAVRGLLQQDASLPVNVKFIIEGEEEVGSPNFEHLLGAHRERLSCDAVVVSDTGMTAPDVPSVCMGTRGLVALQVTIRTASSDLHSGVFGGAVPNSAHVISRLIADLHDESGRVAIPAFYDAVREPSAEETRSLREMPFDESEWLATAGVHRSVGEAGRTIVERTTMRPTCEVVGIHVGYGGEGIKTIVPASGSFKVTFRLVPDQDPRSIEAAFRAWLDDHVPRGIEHSALAYGSVAPMLVPADHPASESLSRAIERVWGTRPLLLREGGSGPEEALARVLDAPVLFLGAGLPGDHIHAPNERMVLDQFWKGLLASAELLKELGDQ